MDCYQDPNDARKAQRGRPKAKAPSKSEIQAVRMLSATARHLLRMMKETDKQTTT